MIKKLLSIIAITILLQTPISLSVNQAMSEETQATASGQTETLTNKIKEKLQETAEEGLDNIKSELITKSKTPKKKAFIGQIKTISHPTLSLEYKTEVFNLNLNESTQITQSAGNKDLKFTNLEVNQFIIAMGFVSPDSPSLETQKILVIANPKPSTSRQLLTGKIKEIDGNKISFDSKSIVITAKTSLQIQDIKEPVIEDLELDDNLFALVTLDQNGDINQVKQVLILPGKNNPAAQEPTNITEASNSAQASKSATIEE